MSKLKRLVRSHNMPLQQIAKRLGEIIGPHASCDQINIKKSICDQQKQHINTITSKDCTVSTSLRDSCFVTSNGDIVVVKSIERISGSINTYNLKCDCFIEKDNFYTEPIESSKLGIYKVKSKNRNIISLFDIRRKCLLLPCFDSDDELFICIPFVSMFLHH